MMCIERRVVSVLAAAIPLLGGCGLLPESPVCLAMPFPAVQLAISDSITGAGLPAARAVVRDGSYSDSARVSSLTGRDTVFNAAYDRPGTYVVTVEHTGYRQWQREGVRARKTDCGADMVRLDVRMQRVAP